MKSDNNLFLFIVLTLDSFLDSKQQSFGITMLQYVFRNTCHGFLSLEKNETFNSTQTW